MFKPGTFDPARIRRTWREAGPYLLTAVYYVILALSLSSVQGLSNEMDNQFRGLFN